MNRSPSATPQPTVSAAAASALCHGLPSLTPRLEHWMEELTADYSRLDELLLEHGSPLNLHQTGAFARNAAEISAAAAGLDLELGIFFARKANKCLAFVEEAGRLGLGVDVAGERELEQTLAAGIEPSRIVLTAAVKPEPLLELCLSAGVTVAVDNLDELARLRGLAQERVGARLPLALRITPTRLALGKPRSRFGLDPTARRIAASEIAADPQLRLVGVHFHLDGYSAAERALTIGEAVELVEELRSGGHDPRFIDIGGGFPISYLREHEQWLDFWSAQREAVLGQREPLTFDGHGLGLRDQDGRIAGKPAVYPYWQEPVRGEWLRGLLLADTQVGGATERVADALSKRGLQLRCEPGRALLDGCGATAARVEFVKPYENGAELIGLAMNRTQCRTSSDDFLVDPLLVQRPRNRGATGAGSPPPPDGDPAGAVEGFLVGTYCIERELLSWRRLRFPGGVAADDIIVFPNTAGYFMHILESSSHQMPLARNLIFESDNGAGARIDPIDRPQRPD